MVKQVKLSVPHREIITHHLDCGWRIEQYSLKNMVDVDVDIDIPDDHPMLKDIKLRNKKVLDKIDLPDDIDCPEFADRKEIFIGLGGVMTRIGPQEVKFEIKDANTIEEAFAKWNDYAVPASKEVFDKVEEYVRKRQGKEIETASPEVLRQLDEQLKQQKDGGIIIP